MVEYQHGKDRSLLTSQNRAPAPAPAGFVPLEPVSYRMTMEGTNGGSNFDFLKIDYILNADSTYHSLYVSYFLSFSVSLSLFVLASRKVRSLIQYILTQTLQRSASSTSGTASSPSSTTARVPFRSRPTAPSSM